MNAAASLPIVYAYPCRWDMAPGRHRHLMEAMSAHVPVILNEARFTGSFVEVLRPRLERLTPNLTLIHNAFGARFARGGKRLGPISAAADSAWLHALLRRIGIDEYVYWLAASAPAMLPGMRTDRLVFDCIDPCFDPSSQDEFDEREFAIARKARMVFCTAESLLERMRPVNPRSFLLPNGCNADEYHPDSLRRLPLPTTLRGRPRPIIGYMGTFDGRVDAATLTEAARQLPESTFAMIGRVNQNQESRVRELRRLRNVVMPGAVSFEEGRAYTAAFDVGLIPFLPGAIGDAINPVKMYMYLMSGKPVVATWLRECRRHAPHVLAARDPAEFIAGIRRALTPEVAAQAPARIAFAMRNTWAERAIAAVGHLRAAGLLTPGKSSKVFRA